MSSLFERQILFVQWLPVKIHKIVFNKNSIPTFAQVCSKIENKQNLNIRDIKFCRVQAKVPDIENIVIKTKKGFLHKYVTV